VAEPTCPEAEVEKLREAYLFVNDPFHTRSIGTGAVVVLVLWAASEALFPERGDVPGLVPSGLLLLMGFASAWSRFHARRGDAEGFRRSLRRSSMVLPWVFGLSRVMFVVFLASMGLLVWLRWERWQMVFMETETGPEDLGGWGSLLFHGSDLGFLPLVLALGWFGFLGGPRFRDAMHIGLAPLDPPPVPGRQ
jgi:hypothetical protein